MSIKMIEIGLLATGLLSSLGASLAQQSDGTPDSSHQFCVHVESAIPDSGQNVFSVLSSDISKLLGLNHTQFTTQETSEYITELVVNPMHGVIERVGQKTTNTWIYKANNGFIGMDHAVFIVKANGRQTRVAVNFKVHSLLPYGFDGEEPLAPCKSGNNESGPVSILFEEVQGLDVATWSPTDRTVRIDPTAAGHGWFLDPTPSQNEEFLPTGNPNVWLAKDGSEAAGKMDLLTVLLHEYGHVLGLDHSQDGQDFMASTLTPGVRRTLSVDQQLQLMQLAGYFPVPDSPSAPYGPTDPGAPLPFTRTNLSTRFGRARSSGLDAMRTEFATVANPKLEDEDFADPSAWATQGQVSFDAPSASATLQESADQQTRLNQVFVVGEHDRFLSFTLNGFGASTSSSQTSGANDPLSSPRDAFEVALLDANSGLSLLGGNGLSRSDAFLNLQEDGQEHLSTGVTRIQNADDRREPPWGGSRTYLVDLAGVTPGTVVNLSFDLIGFGRGLAASNSQVTVSDLRIGVPQTTDDSASTAEDTPVAVDVLANDLNAQQPGFAPEIVDPPEHGSVVFGTDGRVEYHPVANWTGEDSFTYRLTDGVVVSNLASVAIVVSPVNDLPTLADMNLVTEEDSPLSGNALNGAYDVEGDALVADLVSGVSHGSLVFAEDGSFTYTPRANFHGEDSFTVRAREAGRDGKLTVKSSPLNCLNCPPPLAAALPILKRRRPGRNAA